MTSQHSVVFAEPVRTAIGTFGGSLKDVPAPNLGAVAISAAAATSLLGKPSAHRRMTRHRSDSDRATR
jgi:acetyl-CoA acetyltransferase